MADHKCPSCDFVGKSKGSLTRHVNEKHARDPFASLQAKYGSMAPMPGGAWRPDQPLRVAPSGIPSIDHVLGVGGLPKGALVEMYGDPDVGKSSLALMFSAYAQQHGELAGYVDAEKRFQPSMATLITGLDLKTLYYSRPNNGDDALNITREFVETGCYGVWTVDSVHACTPKAMLEMPIGDVRAMASLARLMSDACQHFEPIVAGTNTVLIFVNQVKTIPGVRYGKDWSKPGGSALDYYSSVQLKMERRHLFHDENGRLLGQTVKVRVDKSKLTAPHASTTYDMFIAAGKIKKPGHDRDGQVVFPGVDLGSSWLSVAEDRKFVQSTTKGYIDLSTGETYGSWREASEMLQDDCELRQRLSEMVYGTRSDAVEQVG